MSSRWWRAYDDALDHPKVQMLPDHLFRQWFNLLCLASKNGGVLPRPPVIAFALRTTEEEVEKALSALKDARLIDRRSDGRLEPHDWQGRQFQSGSSAPRMRRKRLKDKESCDVTVTSPVTPPETDTDTDTERKKDIAPNGAVYGFVGNSGIIRLKSKLLADWQRVFSGVNVVGCLTQLDSWLGSDGATDAQRKNWFFLAEGHLRKKDQESRERTKAAADKPRAMEGMR